MRAKFLLLLSFAGCATMGTMINNMSTMNDTIQENIETMKDSGQKIEANTAEVTRSTDQLIAFKKIIAGNTEQMKEGVEGIGQKKSFLPIVFIALVALLFLPTTICILFYYKFFQHMRSNTKR
ncbi:MAG: hypothetical protein JSS30_00100 [Verrucomicrobia bacterium]|nr:hypothetical protein [Verrucomicrobiota bacterium]